MTVGLVTVFGGSGFLGRHVVRAFCKAGWRVRVAMRRPHLGGDLRLAGDVGQVQLVQANVRNRDSVARALEGADAAVNLVGILFERGPQSFASSQAQGARNIAELAAEAGVKRLVYVSAIGADSKSPSAYARTKAEAEAATLAANPGNVVVRPSIIFGVDDGFFNRFAQMSRVSPILPQIGGNTRLAPVYVADVAEAVAAAVTRPDAAGRVFELGGPRIYTMRELLLFIGNTIARPRLLLPLPFIIATPMGYVIGALSRLNPFFGPPLTGDQTQLLKQDNVPADDAPGFAALGIDRLESIEAIVPTYLWRFRPQGQFQEPVTEEVSRVDA
ncbi:NAD(P)H-binding protein [bacterium]|nr:NAD(P)H-binding protein [bacterium]